MKKITAIISIRKHQSLKSAENRFRTAAQTPDSGETSSNSGGQSVRALRPTFYRFILHDYLKNSDIRHLEFVI